MLITSRRAVRPAAAVALLVAGAAAGAGAQQTYPQSLYWGAGLIDIPVAWAAPLTGDFAINYMAKTFEKDPGAPKINYSDQLNSQLTMSMSFVGRIEAGVAFFSSNPEYGLFGQALIVNEEDFRSRTGAVRWLPSLAVGMRNLGPYGRIDRFGVGYELLPPATGSPNYRHVADSLHKDFKTSNTFYGVATKGFSLADIRPSWPDLNLSFTVGYGTGLFKNSGGLDKKLYAKSSTGGLFGGLKADFTPAPHTQLSLMVEHNAWDVNLGGSIDYRGLRFGAYVTELTAGSADVSVDVPESVLYNYSKFAFTVGWQSNIFALLRGNFLQGRVAELERRREGLLAEIQQRQQRIAALQLEIQRYEAQNLLELERRRAEAEGQLKSEREALQRLQEQIRRIESTTNPPPTTRPPSELRQPQR